MIVSKQRARFSATMMYLIDHSGVRRKKLHGSASVEHSSRQKRTSDSAEKQRHATTHDAVKASPIDQYYVPIFSIAILSYTSNIPQACVDNHLGLFITQALRQPRRRYPPQRHPPLACLPASCDGYLPVGSCHTRFLGYPTLWFWDPNPKIR